MGCGSGAPASGAHSNWRHDVRLRSGVIEVDGCEKPVTLRRDEVVIGCTTIDRTVFERITAEFAKHFPPSDADVILQGAKS